MEGLLLYLKCPSLKRILVYTHVHVRQTGYIYAYLDIVKGFLCLVHIVPTAHESY